MAAGTAGHAMWEEKQQHFVRKPAPWPCSNEGVDPWQPTSAYFHICVDRDAKEVPLNVSVCKRQDSSAQPKERT